MSVRRKPKKETTGVPPSGERGKESSGAVPQEVKEKSQTQSQTQSQSPSPPDDSTKTQTTDDTKSQKVQAGDSIDAEESWVDRVDSENSSSVFYLSIPMIADKTDSLWKTHPNADKTSGGSGSGFVIHPSGLAVTNYHVLENVSGTPLAINNGDVRGGYKFALVAALKEIDIAVIKLETDEPLPSAVKIGNSMKVRKGMESVVIHYPLGLSQQPKVTPGIVTGHENGRVMTNSLVHPGSSGSPFFVRVGPLQKTGKGEAKEREAQVVGVVVSGHPDYAGMNFIIPNHVWIHYLSTLLIQQTFRTISSGEFGISVRWATTTDLLADNIVPQISNGGALVLSQLEDIASASHPLDLSEGDILLEIEFPDPLSDSVLYDVFDVKEHIKAAKESVGKKSSPYSEGELRDLFGEKDLAVIPGLHFGPPLPEKEKEAKTEIDGGGGGGGGENNNKNLKATWKRLEKYKTEYYKYKFKSSYPRIKICFPTPKSGAVRISRKESASAAWSEDPRTSKNNWRFSDVEAWIPPSTPIILKFSRKGKLMRVIKVFEPLKSKNIGIKELGDASQKVTMEILGRLVFTDLTEDHVRTCFPSCIDLALTAIKLKKQGKSAVLVKAVLPSDSNNLDKVSVNGVSRTDVISAFELLVPFLTDNKKETPESAKESANPIQYKSVFQSWNVEGKAMTLLEEKKKKKENRIRNLEEFRAFLELIIEKSLKHFDREIIPNLNRFQVAFDLIAKDLNSSTQKGMSFPYSWRSCILLKTYFFESGKTIVFPFPSVIEEDERVGTLFDFKFSLFFKTQAAKVKKLVEKVQDLAKPYEIKKEQQEDVLLTEDEKERRKKEAKKKEKEEEEKGKGDKSSAKKGGFRVQDIDPHVKPKPLVTHPSGKMKNTPEKPRTHTQEIGIEHETTEVGYEIGMVEESQSHSGLAQTIRFHASFEDALKHFVESTSDRYLVHSSEESQSSSNEEVLSEGDEDEAEDDSVSTAIQSSSTCGCSMGKQP